MAIFNSKKEFFTAVASNDLKTVKKYLLDGKDRQKWLTLHYGYSNNTALHIAAYNKRPEMAELLIGYGAPVNALNNNEASPIFLAVEERSIETVAVILKGNPDLGIKKSNGNSVLKIVLDNAMQEKSFFNLTAKSSIDKTMKGIFDLLMKHPQNLQSPDLYKVTGWSEGMRNEKFDFYQGMINAGGKPEEIMLNDMSLFESYIRNRETSKMVWDLVTRGKIDPDKPLSTGHMPLHLALSLGHHDNAHALMNAGANPALRNEEGKTAYDVALDYGFKRLLAAGSGHSSLNADDETETWTRIGTDKIAHIGTYPAIGKKITEIFNFAAHSRYSIINDLTEKTQSQSQPQDFSAIDQTTLEQAFVAYQAQQGPLPREKAIGGQSWSK